LIVAVEEALYCWDCMIRILSVCSVMASMSLMSILNLLAVTMH
jgi:hypothetical protein